MLVIEITKIKLTGGHIEFMLIIEMAKIENNRRYTGFMAKIKLTRGYIGIMHIIKMAKIELIGGHIGFNVLI